MYDNDDDKSEISASFVESMVDRIITELGRKFDELDISLDYIAAALLDDTAINIGARQASLGRHAKMPSRAQAPQSAAEKK